jgi:glycosyltransferase involved in cell wall biosynthesis
LYISTLLPNPAEPMRGVFNFEQLRALAKLANVKAVAPTDAAMPSEHRGGVDVIHPRFFHIPLLSRPLNGRLFARAIEPVVCREQFDVVFVAFAYPDAYGVMLLARKYHFPFVTSVLGSDINVLFKNAVRKWQIMRALRASATVFAVSDALRRRLAAEGVDAVTLYDGVDREKFHAMDRREACRLLGVPHGRRRILYAGNLVPIKGPGVLAAAIRESECMKDVDVVFVGSGPEAGKIDASDRICLVGPRPHEEIPLWLNACDVLCLPSLNEGTPNIVLEALACGVPVVASRVGGVPEIVRQGENGILVEPRDARALAEALQQALETGWDRDKIQSSVQRFDWNENAARVVAALEDASQRRPRVH